MANSSFEINGSIIASSGSFIVGSGSAGSPSFEFSGDTDTGMFSPAINTIALATSGVERLRVDSIGNVGIGTATPGYQLDVSGIANIGNNLRINSQVASTIAGFDGSKNVISLSTETYPSLTELSYVKGLTSAIQTQINSKQNTLTNPVTGVGTSGYLTKWISSSGVGSGVIFDNGTNIGIGTSSPSGKLDINGTLYVGTTGVANNFYIRTGQAGISETALKLRSDTSSNLYLDASNAYVKVGNQSADVDIAAGNAGIRIGNNSAQTLANQNIRFVPANTEIMRITPTGVGVGITNPLDLIHISGTSTGGQGIRLENADGYGGSIQADNGQLYVNSNSATAFRVAGRKIRLGDGGVNACAIELSSVGSISQDGNGGGLTFSGTTAQFSNGINVTGSGTFTSIGVGTSTPSGQLHVIGSGIFSSGLFVGSTPVSVSGHSHTSSDITNFNSSVSGLINGIYAPLNSPALIGVPTVPTASSGTNTTQIASTAFVRTEISNLVASAPSTLDTLNELATALGNDANFATTVTNNLAGKANLSGATFTGSISGPSGNFVSLKSNGIDVSLSGHNHNGVYADIATGNPLTSSNSIVDNSYALYDPANGWPGLWIGDSSVNASDPAVFDSFKENMGLLNAAIGTGVANHIAYWNSSSGIVADSGQLVWDSTNNRLGIGTSTPSSQLHVVGTGTFDNSIRLGSSSTSGTIIGLSTSGTIPAIIFDTVGNNHGNQQALYDFRENGISFISIDGIGNLQANAGNIVGIATNPSADNGAFIGHGMRRRTSNAGMEFTWGESITSVSEPGIDLFPIGGTHISSGILFRLSKDSNKTDVAVIVDGSGRVGIGTTTPSNGLEVAGGNVLIGPTDTSRQLNFYSSAYGIKAENGLEIFTGDRIRFRKGGVEYARIESDGKVGIGTTTPSGQLHVVGTGIISSRLGIATNSPGATLDVRGSAVFNEDGANVDFRVEGDTDTNLLFVDASADKVGIGTNSPTQKLHIVGNLLVEDSGPYSVISATESEGFTIYGDVGFSNAGILFTDRTNGRIGIGTNAPNANLAISAGGAGGTIDGTVQSQPFQINDATASDYINLAHFNITNSASRGSFTLSNNSSSDWINNVMQFFVHGTGYPHAYYCGNTSDAGCAMIVTQGSEITKLQIGNYNSAPIEFFTDNTFRAVIDTVGNLGIGTSTPSEALDVAGNININGYIRHTFGAADYSSTVIAPIIWYNIYNDINTDIAKIDVATDSSPAEGMLVFHTNDGSSLQERLRITDIGNVGIGTATPSASLDVVGNVNIDGNLTFDSFTESVVSNGNSGTSKTLSLASGTVHTCTLTGNCTFTMPTSTAGKSFTMFLNSGSGNYTASFSNVRWADSATPTATILANKVDIYSFISDGTYWYGSFSQNYG